jgi:hypothetical protein
MYSKFFLRQEILEKVEKFLIFLIRQNNDGQIKVTSFNKNFVKTTTRRQNIITVK